MADAGADTIVGVRVLIPVYLSSVVRVVVASCFTLLLGVALPGSSTAAEPCEPAEAADPASANPATAEDRVQAVVFWPDPVGGVSPTLRGVVACARANPVSALGEARWTE